MIGDILNEMIAILLEKLPQFAGQKIPKFLIKQLDSFNIRHNIKKYKQHKKPKAFNLLVIKKEL